MNIRKLPNGNLAMEADCNEREDIKRLLADKVLTMISMEAIFIAENLIDPMGDGVDYQQVQPEEVGALTGAAIISDGDNVWGYMDYQVKNFLDELAEGREVVWQKG